MKEPIELARQFLKLAEDDIKSFKLLASSSEIANSQVGFHAQQALEKCLKAVLVLNKIEFRKTHDLNELLELLHQHKISMPPNSDLLDEFNPYAVSLRYDLFYDEISLDRELAAQIIANVFSWASKLILKDKAGK